MRWRRKKKKGKAEEAVAVVHQQRSFGDALDADSAECPLIVTECIEYLRATGIDMEGIFRIPGQVSEIKRLKKHYDDTGRVDFTDILNPHTVAGLLKLYLRELPVPLLTFELYDVLIDAHAVEDEEERIGALTQIVQLLPVSSHSVLNTLFVFLNEVAEHSSANKMSVDNVAMVFGPNIMRPRVETMEQSFKDSSAVAVITATLIRGRAAIFHTETYLSELEDFEEEIARLIKENEALKAELADDTEDSEFKRGATRGSTSARSRAPPPATSPVALTPLEASDEGFHVVEEAESAATAHVYTLRVKTLKTSISTMTLRTTEKDDVLAAAQDVGAIGPDEMPYEMEEGLVHVVKKMVSLREPNYFQVELCASTGTMRRHMAEMVDLAALPAMLPMDVCRYHVIVTPLLGVALIVHVPTICKHFLRLQYVSLKDAFVGQLARLGLEVTQQFVVCDPYEVDDDGTYVHAGLHPPQKVETAPFRKPVGPAKKRGGRRLTRRSTTEAGGPHSAQQSVQRSGSLPPGSLARAMGQQAPAPSRSIAAQIPEEGRP